MKIRKLLAALLLFFLFGAGAACLAFGSPRRFERDPLLYNRIAFCAGEHWDSLTEETMGAFGVSLTVFDNGGNIRYSQGRKAAADLGEALKRGDAVADIEICGVRYGKIAVREHVDTAEEMGKRAAMCVFFLTVVMTLCGAGYTAWLYFRVVRPFATMQRFAAEVAGGNLDFPLTVSKDHIFGAFTESFDLMREELTLSRARELDADRKKKELVASLSHDIKTPVTSIKLNSELLMALSRDARQKEKLAVVYQKAEQIDQLVTNLFQSTLRDLEELAVEPEVAYSSRLYSMLREADYCGKVRVLRGELPECLLYMDELRLSQVLSNIIHNSYKYAGTPISAEAQIEGEHLKLALRDYGPGVEEEEIPQLCSQYYRGKNAAGMSGSGLGLYLCKKMMERMQGGIECRNTEDGFETVVYIKLVRA